MLFLSWVKSNPIHFEIYIYIYTIDFIYIYIYNYLLRPLFAVISKLSKIKPWETPWEMCYSVFNCIYIYIYIYVYTCWGDFESHHETHAWIPEDEYIKQNLGMIDRRNSILSNSVRLPKNMFRLNAYITIYIYIRFFLFFRALEISWDKLAPLKYVFFVKIQCDKKYMPNGCLRIWEHAPLKYAPLKYAPLSNFCRSQNNLAIYHSTRC